MSNISAICKEYVDLICNKIACDGHMKNMIREAIEKSVTFVVIQNDEFGDVEFPVRGDLDRYVENDYEAFPVIELDCITGIDYEHGDS